MIDPSLLSMADWICCEVEADEASFGRHDAGTGFFRHGKSGTPEIHDSLLDKVKRTAATPDIQLA